jgi:hypothetical protein
MFQRWQRVGIVDFSFVLGGAMNTKMLTKARQLFSVDYMPKQINRANQRKWVRAIRMLGDKWLIAHQIKRIEP